MKYALIACGGIAAKHMTAVTDNNIEIIAVCDLVPDSIEALLNRSSVQSANTVNRYTDYKSMLEENNIDLVAIATGSGSHAEIAQHCINLGVNVIIEKPMAMSIEDADKIIELSTQKKVKVAVCHPNRFNASVQKTRDAVVSGRLGKISHGTVHIRWNRNRDYYNQATWRGKWASDGGALMNQCIHGIDLLQWIINDTVEEVYGVTKRQFHDYLEAEDLGVAIVKFKNGSIATIEGTVNVYPNNLEETLYLFGEKGTVKLGGKSADTIEVWDFADETDISSKTADKDSGSGHTRLYADMLGAIENDREPLINATEGKSAVELVLAIYRSQKEGVPVKLPLKSFSVIEMAGEFDEVHI